MDIIRLCAWGYAALLSFVIITGYVPAFIDQNDMIFACSGAPGMPTSFIWSPRGGGDGGADLAARLGTVLPAVRMFYFADGVLGLLTGSGYLDFGILINGIATCR